jgi:hypothetical protein
MKAYKGALTQRLWNLMRDASLSAPHVTVEGDGCFYFPLGTATWACSRGEAVTLIVARSMAGALSSLLEEQVEIHGLTEAGDGRMLTLPLRGVEVLDDGRMRVVVATREQVLFALRYPLS